MREAKAHLSRLVDAAARGDVFVIAKAGKPLVKVVPVDVADTTVSRRLGFMAGEVAVPSDFDRMGEDATRSMFGAD